MGSGQTFHPDFVQELYWWQRTARQTETPGTVVYGGDSSTRYKNCTILSWRGWG